MISSALLVLEHVALWGPTWRVERPWNYAMGVATLLVGAFVWGATTQGPVTAMESVFAFFLISTSGVWVIAGYYLRDRHARHKQSVEKTAQAKQLTQALIDERGKHGAREPDVDSRWN